MEIEIKTKADLRLFLNNLGWYINKAYFWENDNGVIKLLFNKGESIFTFTCPGGISQLDSWLTEILESGEFSEEFSIYDVYGELEGSDSVECPCPVNQSETMTRTAWKENCGAAGERINCTCGFSDSQQFSSGCWQRGHNQTYDWDHPNDPHHTC